MSARATLRLTLPLALPTVLLASCSTPADRPEQAAQEAEPAPSAAEVPQAPSPALIDPAVDRALAWLVAHQDQDGRWDCDEFMKHDLVSDPAGGAGESTHDVGVTGLALLALLGAGHSMTAGDHSDAVKRAVGWLLDQQDRDSGRIRSSAPHDFMYDHAIATFALCETARIDGSATVRRKAREAIKHVCASRNPYRVWRYAVPPDGDNDTSITGWMLLALASAKDGDIAVDNNAFESALEWFDEVTDSDSGRVGYINSGSRSARTRGINEHYPTDVTETMTAVALACRGLLGQDPAETPVMEQHAELLLRALPRWSEDGMTNDMTYWHFGTMAMFQMGGAHWDRWRAAMGTAALAGQRDGGSAAGSWDPNGPWGYAGGRVMSTALTALALESVGRYGNLMAAR